MLIEPVEPAPDALPDVPVPENVCVCDGKFATANVAVVAPPVALTAYVEPAPTTKRSRRFGVLFRPSQITQPDGIEAIEPDQSKIIPATNADGAADTQPVPVDVKTLPAVPAEVMPVPPLATATVPVTFAAVPVVFWLPAVLTPGKLMLAEPLKLTPPMVRAVVRVAAEPVVF